MRVISRRRPNIRRTGLGVHVVAPGKTGQAARRRRSQGLRRGAAGRVGRGSGGNPVQLSLICRCHKPSRLSRCRIVAVVSRRLTGQRGINFTQRVINAGQRLLHAIRPHLTVQQQL